MSDDKGNFLLGFLVIAGTVLLAGLGLLVNLITWGMIALIFYGVGYWLEVWP